MDLSFQKDWIRTRANRGTQPTSVGVLQSPGANPGKSSALLESLGNIVC